MVYLLKEKINREHGYQFKMIIEREEGEILKRERFYSHPSLRIQDIYSVLLLQIEGGEMVR